VLFTRRAKDIIQKYKNFLNDIPADMRTKRNVQIGPYKGQNEHVHRMMSFLSEHLKDDLIGAYVHGSLGTGEEIAYSDFDALVILKLEVFELTERLARVARKLNRARKIMLDYDPLEHHGWFVLTELDLKFYCDAYFPVELFQYAKSLFDNKGLELEISSRESSFETRKAFEKMAETVIKKIENQQYPVNMYQLKSLLSQFMLLPTLYLQAKNGKGVFKKESFDKAKIDFDSADWSIMDEVSNIRANWNYGISALKKRIMCNPHVLSRAVAKKYVPTISNRMKEILKDDFYYRMQHLVTLMQEDLH
jgi:predicted nucleotidyltransferase